MKKILSILTVTALLTFVSAVPVQGRLGETKSEIEARYGTPKKEKNSIFSLGKTQYFFAHFSSIYYYESNGFQIHVVYDEITGRSELERFSGDLTEARITVLMEAFGGGEKWVYVDRALAKRYVDQYWGQADHASRQAFDCTPERPGLAWGHRAILRRLPDNSIFSIVYNDGSYWDMGGTSAPATIIFMTGEFAQIDHWKKHSATEQEKALIRQEEQQKQQEREKDNERKRLRNLY